jgi:hypothetical protein
VIRNGGTPTPIAIDSPETIAQVESAWGRFGDFLDRLASMRPYILDLAEEARELMLKL